MALLVPNVAEQEMLKRILDTNVTLKLYTNNKTPAESDVHGNYTEATAAGYAAKTLVPGSWSYALDSDDYMASYAAQDFVFTAGETVYGYYVIGKLIADGVTDVLLWAERFTDAPYVVPSGGGTIRVTPRIKLA